MGKPLEQEPASIQSVENHIVLSSQDQEPGLQELVNKADQFFQQTYGYAAERHAKGSTRVEDEGNFVDQAFGLYAIGFATNLGVVAASSHREDRFIRIASDIDPDHIETINLDKLPEVHDTSHWSNYHKSILNILRDFLNSHANLKQFKDLQGIDIALAANVPPGTGISTSAAIEAAFLRSFLSANQIELTERAIVDITKRAENAAGSGCGILDQAISNTQVPPDHGVWLHFKDPGDGIGYEATPVYMRVEAHGAQFVLVFAKDENGVPLSRNLAGIDYGKKAEVIKAGCMRMAKALDVDFENLTMKQYEQFIQSHHFADDDEAKLVKHVLSDNERVLETVEYLKMLANTEPGTRQELVALLRLGGIMNSSAESSIENYGVKTGVKEMPSFEPLLTTMMDLGAYGARNEGGGGIPTSLGLVPIDKIEEMKEQLPKIMQSAYPNLNFEVVPVSVGKPSRVLQVDRI